VKFSDPPSHNEFFQSLVITGAMRAHTPVTAAVSYETTYNVPVDIVCELRQGTTVIRIIGRDEIPAYLAGNPKATPVPGNFAYDFAVDDPGSYKVRCYTDLDKDNFITKAFTVRPAQ
jgi:hypothetical protein